jgi:CheY-like chemotaxis protein
MMTARKRILIVDDEQSFTRLLQLNLHHTGRYTAKTVNNPVEALAAAKEFSPHVILMDVMMPGLDGGELASRIHDSPQLRDTPIIFLTAAVRRSEVASREGLVGNLPFIAKPIEFQEVVECIEKQPLLAPVGPRKFQHHWFS